MTSVAAEQFHREHEPDFFARKCRRCKRPEAKCECDDGEPSPRHRDDDADEIMGVRRGDY